MRVMAAAMIAYMFAVLPGAAADTRCSLEQLQAEATRDAWLSGVARFYDLWGGCAWSEDAAATFHGVLTRAQEHGLPPVLLRADEVGENLRPVTGTAAARRDLMLTEAALRYAKIMREGRVDLARLYGDVSLHRWSADPASELVAALRSGHLAHWLDHLPPLQPEYRRLRQALVQYRAIASRGEWPELRLPGGKRSLKPDEQDVLVPQLAARLHILGDLDRHMGADLYDAPKVEAVRRFQARHGLVIDGVVGRDTLAALNLKPAARVRQIELNMERWRYMAHATPPTRLEVNAAAADAAVIREGGIVFRMKTVVGKPSTPTPLIVSAIERVVVNPPWVIPHSIYRREIAPAIERNPDYLREHEMAWQGAHLVQRPGAKNALGRLKFDFPSPFAVFLHDTNAPALFGSDSRFRSNGCIRVERPMELALQLLEPSGWTRVRIEELVRSGQTVSLRVDLPLPVVIGYWTAFVDTEGTIQFRDDIYGRDRALAAVLDGKAISTAQSGEGWDCGS